MAESAQARAHCPECQFSYAWDGLKCGHCYPPPEQVRRRWEEFVSFSRLVDFRKTYTARQLAAIAAACLRRAWESLPDETKELIEELEAEGTTSLIGKIVRDLTQQRGIEVAHIAPSDRWLESMQLAPRGLTQLVVTIASMSRALTCKEAFPDRTFSSSLQQEYEEQKYEEQKLLLQKTEQAIQCDIARDVIGFPESTVNFETEWRTSTACAIGRGMHESGEYSSMPILADALQDAGCDDCEVLDHCRGSKLHFRGCWVISYLV